MQFDELQPHDHDRIDYLGQFRKELLAKLNQRRVRDADDISQAEFERVEKALPALADSYPNPEMYASLRFTPAVSDHFRRERVQRGEGSRAFIDEEGIVRNGRTVVSGDSAHPWLEDDVTLFDTLPPVERDWADVLDARAAVARALSCVSPEDAEIVYLSLALEYSDGEIADHLGYARETINRRKKKAVNRIRGFLGPDKV